MPLAAYDPSVDWSDPYTLPPKPLRPGVPPATLPGAANFEGAFQPDTPGVWSDWTRQPLPDSAFNPQITSSGSAGQGRSGQPEVDSSISPPRASSGALLARSAPPPVASPASPTTTPPDTPSGPPPLPNRMPPPTSERVNFDTQKSTPLQKALEGAEARVADAQANLGPMKSNWAQRLGMAVLSMTKLAPYANQIIHPKYSAQLGTLEQAEKDLGEVSKAREAEQRGEWYGQQAAESKGRYLRVGTGVFDQQAGKWVTMPMDKTNLVPVDPEIAKQRGLAPMDDGKFWVPAQVAAQIARPVKDPANFIEIAPGEGQRLGIQPDTDGKYYIPKEGIAPYISGKEKPLAAPTAESEKIAYQNALSKMSAAGELPPGAATDSKMIDRAIQNSRTLTSDEKNHARAWLAANTSPASQGTAAQIRVEGMANSREYPVINRNTGQLEMRSAAEINAAKGVYAPAGAGATAMTKEAVFGDLHYNIETARKAIQALDSLDAPTRAALSFAMRHTDPASAFQTFLTGAAATNMTPQQMEAVQALALLNENALSLRSVAGMGQGAEDLRSAIQATLPSGKSPTKGYALGQLNKFEQVVNRLEKGVPTVRGNAGNQPAGGRGNPGTRPPLNQIFQ